MYIYEWVPEVLHKSKEPSNNNTGIYIISEKHDDEPHPTLVYRLLPNWVAIPRKTKGHHWVAKKLNKTAHEPLSSSSHFVIFVALWTRSKAKQSKGT
jgi:hypothetical protein